VETSIPWLTIVEAAKHLGYACANGRAPNSMYAVADEIGYRVNGRWLIHPDDLDAWVRSQGQAQR
jgi:hypothetical protein